MISKQHGTAGVGRRYILHRPALSWVKAATASSLGLFFLYFLNFNFLEHPLSGLHQDTDMALSSLFQASALATSLVALTAAQEATTTPSTPTGWSTTLAGTATAFQPVFTIPASADEGVDLIPNIQDPQAVNAQDVCPGYKASQLKETEDGISAVLKLAGSPCNVYGNDVDVLNLKVEYQSKDRLAVNISPAYLVCPFQKSQKT